MHDDMVKFIIFMIGGSTCPANSNSNTFKKYGYGSYPVLQGEPE
jgi:hypothetical protein